MRHIGSFANEAQARFFTDFLLSRNIRSQLEAEPDRTWSIWIRDEDQIVEAQAALNRFLANPRSPEFEKAPEAAEQARQTEAEDLARYRKRIRSGRSLFVKFGSYGVGPLTFVLILACGFIAIAKAAGDAEWTRYLYISDPDGASGGFLPEVMHGQIWRLFTPILMHDDLGRDPLHLIFNMLWLYQLGSMIEARKNSLFLFGFIAVSAALSNVAQYRAHGPSFLGMSGVVYALAGYIWIRGKYDRASGLYLSPQNVAILLIWLVVCYTGLIGPIANTAHLVGLLTGMAWGGLAALIARQNPQ